MKESDFNTIFKNSLLSKNIFAYKIFDIGGNIRIPAPSDGFFLSENFSGLWEGKKLKGITSFNFNRLEPFQRKSLGLISSYKNLYAIVCIYFDINKGSKLLMIDYNLILYLLKNSKKSILKKEFLLLEDLMIELNKKMFNIDFKKILTIDIWNERIGVI